MNTVNTKKVSGYRWGDGGEAWPLVDTLGLSVKEELMAAGTSETEHWHERSRQFFYVLEGEAALMVGDTTCRLDAGDGLEVPPGERHRIANTSDRPLRVLVISSPSTAYDRVEAGAGHLKNGLSKRERD